MKKILLCSVIFILGCATEYGPSGLLGGYKAKVLADGNIELIFSGNRATSTQTISLYWDRRASELCPNGYIVLEKKNSSTTVYYPSEYIIPEFKGIIQCK
jgi:hypothetical protein